MIPKKVTNKQILKIGAICLVFIFFIGIIPIIPEPKVCFTTPCPQSITVFEAVQKLEFSDNLPINPNPSDDVSCIEIYQPVCGKDGMTYSNICFLELSETLLDHQGEC